MSVGTPRVTVYTEGCRSWSVRHGQQCTEGRACRYTTGQQCTGGKVIGTPRATVYGRVQCTAGSSTEVYGRDQSVYGRCTVVGVCSVWSMFAPWWFRRLVSGWEALRHCLSSCPSILYSRSVRQVLYLTLPYGTVRYSTVRSVLYLTLRYGTVRSVLYLIPYLTVRYG